MSILRAICSVGVFISSIVLGLNLLLTQKIQGPEFVALIVAFIILSVFIFLLPNVHEISIGPTLVKLNKAKEESDQIIQDLRDTRLEMFRMLLKDSLSDGSFWGTDALKDKRISIFLRTYNKIVEAKCKNELTAEINQTLNLIIENQSRKIKNCSPKMAEKFENDEIITAPLKYSVFLSDEIVEDFRSRRRRDLDSLQVKTEIIEAINEYAKIYPIYISELAP
ncbi:MAG: hypothetical protein KAZ18_00255 [Acinetobacter sp.]|uniref:hypothetical protein n=1 Tax=Acinetobacter haemolyticus TaxID=29430 RepID=UPI001150EA88|nr:hypothetical protein [Acinetobacter haemolyticus]MBP8005328.1 hypothetical protein [Acinetobacter sp.]QDJ92708.1 hypothetical protein AhaeAN54_011805 [Acinetobacter haemolyticus]